MPTTADPVEFTRGVDDRRGLQRCGNVVQVEGTPAITIDGGTGQETMANSWPVVIASDQSPIEIVPANEWEPYLASDEAANDSDKTFTVPASTWWQVLWIWVELTSTATVGNRQIVVQLQDASADVIAEFRAGEVQAASLTRYYQFGPSLNDLEDFRDTDYLQTPIPPTLILPASYVVRVYDNNAVDAAADDMVVQMMVARRAV